jgi:hypothetical protein
MLRTANLKPLAYVLYYEILDINIVETKKCFKVTWLGNTIKEEVYYI